ncbi:MAG TPA: ATP-binding protein [Pseudonocardiaceae bacterium]|nr:ATP-binding protein [Pseudonocardiaceae bacterium]
MTTAVRLRLERADDVPRRLAEVVAGVARRAGLAERAAYRLRLAVDELATNVVTHGYHGGPGRLDVAAGYDADWVWLRLEDDAPPFDPRSHDSAPALDGPPREGGYGIFLALTNVDSFDYARIGGRNRSTLLMRRPGARVPAGVDAGGVDTVAVDSAVTDDGGTDGQYGTGRR